MQPTRHRGLSRALFDYVVRQAEIDSIYSERGSRSTTAAQALDMLVPKRPRYVETALRNGKQRGRSFSVSFKTKKSKKK